MRERIGLLILLMIAFVGSVYFHKSDQQRMLHRRNKIVFMFHDDIKLPECMKTNSCE